MNQVVNYFNFVDMFLDSNDDDEPCECSDINESLKKIYNNIQAYKAGFNDREYVYDK